jgi:hypothetical protein
VEIVHKSGHPSIADLAEKTARRRAPSSPHRKQRMRELRRFAIAVVLISGSSIVCLWLLLA